MRSLEQTEPTEDIEYERPGRVLALRGILPGDDTWMPLDRTICIGRDVACELRLDRQRVSRRHVEIYRQGPIHAVRDLSSTNGTYVDGVRVSHTAIRLGMLLRVGDWLGIVEEGPEDAGRFGFQELVPGLFGGSRVREVLEQLARVARTKLPLVFTAPTGCGKERFARAAHELSGRSGPFHAINCAAIPAALAEAELFGSRKGAFTGAERAYAGHLLAANGGTLFLDELSELPYDVQPKLLRAIELREVQPLGETKVVKFEAGLVVATRLPLDELVARGEFRADLAERLKGMVLTLPTLSERRSDIPGLFHAFLQQQAAGGPPLVSTKLYERLCLFGWQGNVRELELLAHRLFAEYGSEPRLHCHHLPSGLTPANEEGAQAWSVAPNRDEDDGRRLSRALEQVDGNMKRAAALVGISRQRAYRLMRGPLKSSLEACRPDES